MKLKNNKKGFTLVELVIVIAVIAILAAVLIPTFASVIGNANKSALQSEARNLYTGIMVEYADDAKGFDGFLVDYDENGVAKETPKTVSRDTEIGEETVGDFVSEGTTITNDATSITLKKGKYSFKITKAGVEEVKN